MVGTTCRLDAVELLEKRVRSRFSHEKDMVLPLVPHADQDPADTPQEVLQALLQLPQDVGVTGTFALRFNAAVGEAVRDGQVQAALRTASIKGT